jgi:hypothetical protein
MSSRGLTSERASWCGTAEAERLLARVRAACAGKAGLPARLEAGLRAALEMLAEEPELARLLTLDPSLGSAADGELNALREWTERFGALLREAAAADPRANTAEPSFLAPFLIGGVRFQIGRLVASGEGSDLPRLLPSLLEGLLSYYYEPGEPRALAEAALKRSA